MAIAQAIAASPASPSGASRPTEILPAKVNEAYETTRLSTHLQTLFQCDKGGWIPWISEEVAFCSLLMEEFRRHAVDFDPVVLPPSIECAVRKRREEFAAGRLCAQHVCQQLTGNKHVIGQDFQKRPIWPPGVVGSISHTSEMAVCAAAKQGSMRSIGIDCERMVDDPSVTSSIHQLVLVEGEESLIDRVEDYFLIFSLKESLFKCLNPLTPARFDFQDIRVVEIDRKGGVAYLECGSDRVHSGYFSLDRTRNHVHSCVYIDGIRSQ